MQPRTLHAHPLSPSPTGHAARTHGHGHVAWAGDGDDGRGRRRNCADRPRTPGRPPRARASRNGLQAMNGYCGGLNSRGRTDGGIDGGDGCGRRSVRRRLHPGSRPAGRLPVKLWPRWHAKSGRGSNGSRILHGRNCPSHMTNESANESGKMLHTQTLDE